LYQLLKNYAHRSNCIGGGSGSRGLANGKHWQTVIIALINSQDWARFFSSEIKKGPRTNRTEVTINFINFDLNFHRFDAFV